MCGACHDIVSPAGPHRADVRRVAGFAVLRRDRASQGVTTCAASGCHMVQQSQLKPIVTIQTPDGGSSPTGYHRPRLPGGGPGAHPVSERRDGAARPSSRSSPTRCREPSASPGEAGAVGVILDTVSLGHDLPERRGAGPAAYGPKSSRAIRLATSSTRAASCPTGRRRRLWGRPTRTFGSSGIACSTRKDLVDMFWQGATTDGNELPPIQAFFPSPLAYASHKVRFFPESGGPLTNDAGAPQMPASVTLRVRFQPIGRDVLNDLVSTGDSGRERRLRAAPSHRHPSRLRDAEPAHVDRGGGGRRRRHVVQRQRQPCDVRGLAQHSQPVARGRSHEPEVHALTPSVVAREKASPALRASACRAATPCQEARASGATAGRTRTRRCRSPRWFAPRCRFCQRPGMKKYVEMA